MSILTPGEQELYDHAQRNLPQWYTEDARANEFIGAAAKLMQRARAQNDDWLRKQTFILTADGPTSTTPDWLGQHARDRGTRRRNGEGDPSLRIRLRNVDDAVTRLAILAAAQAILDAAGVVGTVYAIELPRDEAFVGVFTSAAGTGGTFVDPVGTGMTFASTVPLTKPPYHPIFPITNYELIISGAANAGNNGTFPITGVVGNAVAYTNASGVAAVDATVAWTVRKKDITGNIIDGFARAYAGRGYRVGGLLPTGIIILPFGTPEAVRLAVLAMLREKKIFGVIGRVERREVP